MGTNYYIHINKCDHCGRFDSLHVGTSSHGWRFHFNLNVFRNPTKWKEELQGKIIEDEYGRIISHEEFIELVENKQHVVEPNYTSEYNPRIIINDYIFFEQEFS